MESNHELTESPGLAPLPREQIGPFLILGITKDADLERIEAAWAQRVLWARQGKTRTPLEDIHWARSVLRDPEQRLLADAKSLNADIADEPLRALAKSWGCDPEKPSWTPIDPDPADAAVEIPDPDVIHAAIAPPDIPIELPGIDRWLIKFGQESIDPWSVNLPKQDSTS